jgi:hypothetical protein
MAIIDPTISKLTVRVSAADMGAFDCNASDFTAGRFRARDFLTPDFRVAMTECSLPLH